MHKSLQQRQERNGKNWVILAQRGTSHPTQPNQSSGKEGGGGINSSGARIRQRHAEYGVQYEIFRCKIRNKKLVKSHAKSKNRAIPTKSTAEQFRE